MIVNQKKLIKKRGLKDVGIKTSFSIKINETYQQNPKKSAGLFLFW
ncbi:MAG: hypothetical protein ACI9FJ_001103 [Alteromonadaceae bacterium]|jgi:hypothetical protein